jgi:hypothetical protein
MKPWSRLGDDHASVEPAWEAELALLRVTGRAITADPDLKFEGVSWCET